MISLEIQSAFRISSVEEISLQISFVETNILLINRLWSKDSFLKSATD